MKVVLIRHGLTKGNLERRYIGSTDESLCEEGVNSLQSLVAQHIYPEVKQVFISPMKRCIETAGIIYPNQHPIIEEDFRECDFGLFEYKTYEQLKENIEYIQWLDSEGKGTIPQGEGQEAFKLRCHKGFYNIMENLTVSVDEKDTIGFILHGGTIMAIMEEYASPPESFYHWQCKNGEGYVCRWDFAKKVLLLEAKISILDFKQAMNRCVREKEI
ncbi:alpha-ribazole phosphatase [Anaerocolumna cellulosilytica]|uniref:Alpha-ribazole phosphatase n=1 Tax=Anaerocolumna cellulosilytica TaxID=433286 RepID=A0A6S6RA81_9FIRM|nr:histidine phosphatase family protein [Anaerocolumna cellulosilytica]MBB5196362.1 alpha-ribazole phosphatase [Anaerocolumna cellulosilytica]BCJ96390.1 alpha-ribazole phosphatase [Anaerocolumna cellulosilytica]